VTDTDSLILSHIFKSALHTVPFPTPDGPLTTISMMILPLKQKIYSPSSTGESLESSLLPIVSGCTAESTTCSLSIIMTALVRRPVRCVNKHVLYRAPPV
jgi:hypothetical protein